MTHASMVARQHVETYWPITSTNDWCGEFEVGDRTRR
jgi:hypothetical protein